MSVLRAAGKYDDQVPSCITDNLNDRLELRPYQRDAFCNFINYYENESLCRKPTKVLFHMATGSGKTLIMAGLILYLFKRGYRNFLFFVNLDNIVQKTKGNFLSTTSIKYLFSETISIDGETILIREVPNFQDIRDNCINICFTTTQGLHSEMWNVKEGSMSVEDFEERKIVMISDEAHHLNADTKNGRKGEVDNESRTWEYTVNRLWDSNRENILLEFTATCDLQNPYILEEYENKIIFDYPLRRFREEKYSKEVKAIRADINRNDRVIQAILFSQYRLKVFQDHRLGIKPIVLFKAKTKNDSKEFYAEFQELLAGLNGKKIRRIMEKSPLTDVKHMFDYFTKRKIDLDALAHELRSEFSLEHCISANDEREATERQILLNTLEREENPFRAVFEVQKLDEGWDVLNLFDIVRLYETRDASKGKPGKTTISEAQLIGRGARYCPFIIEEGDDKYKRKYDDDIDNPLRVCEELFYHCQYDSRYIDELNKALIATGIMPEEAVDIRYELKTGFKKSEFYKKGVVFSNRRVENDDVKELLPSIRKKEYEYSVNTGKTTMDTMMMGAHTNSSVKTHVERVSVSEIASINYNIVHKASRRIKELHFNRIKRNFPHLKSMREFITSPAYLGNVKIAIETQEEHLSPDMMFGACLYVFQRIGDAISSVKQTYRGTCEFYDRPFREVFKDKTIHITDPHGEGEGISQNDKHIRDDWRINLSDEEWFAFNDNYGTTEEKSFVAYFSRNIDEIKANYDMVYLVRNERQLVLYSFDGGERFEPDYLLFLRKNKNGGYEQYQIFIEPKGTHLLEHDKWKEDFLLQIKQRGITTKTFVDDNKYLVWGLPFYNHQMRMDEFGDSFNKLINDG